MATSLPKTKALQVIVRPEQLVAVKVAAAKQGKTIKEFVLEHLEDDVPELKTSRKWSGKT